MSSVNNSGIMNVSDVSSLRALISRRRNGYHRCFFLSFRCESGEEDGEEEYFLTSKPLFFFFFFLFLFLLLTLECCSTRICFQENNNITEVYRTFQNICILSYRRNNHISCEKLKVCVAADNALTNCEASMLQKRRIMI